MAELWVILSLLREKCEEDSTTQHLCKEIAEQYIEAQKRELRVQVAREQNLRLKLDLGNMKSFSHLLSENNEAHSELNTLLQKYYKEHLKVCFDLDECEMEKLYSFDTIKLELESRDTIQIYQQIYSSKTKTAMIMESRNIVGKYRKKTEELLKTQDELFALENSLNELKVKIKKDKEVLHQLIYRLVKGAKDLQTIYARPKSSNGPLNTNRKPDKSGHLGTVERTNSVAKIAYKGGLSAKLSLDSRKCEILSVPTLPKIRTIDLTKSRNRLLQQAEDLRRTMQRTVNLISDEPAVLKFPSILKQPTKLPTSPECSRKTVSFEKNLLPAIIDASQDISQINLEATFSANTFDSESKQNFVEETKTATKMPKVEILENIILKPACSPSKHLPVAPVLTQCEPNGNFKRKINENVANSQPKKRRIEFDAAKLDSSMTMSSKSFMNMFLGLSKDTSTEAGSLEEPTKKVSGDIEMEMAPSVDQKKNIKTNKTKGSFDDFEDFLSGFADVGSDDNNCKEQSEADMSFDFDADNDGGDAGSDSMSFNF